MGARPNEFRNTSTKGNSGKCHSNFCTGRNAVCKENVRCCTCRCNVGTFYNQDTCVALPTTTRTSTTTAVSSNAYSSMKSTTSTPRKSPTSEITTRVTSVFSTKRTTKVQKSTSTTTKIVKTTGLSSTRKHHKRRTDHSTGQGKVV